MAYLCTVYNFEILYCQGQVVGETAAWDIIRQNDLKLQHLPVGGSHREIFS